MDKVKIIKQLLFAGILCAISVPMVLTFFPVIEFEPLDGSFEEKVKPELNFADLYSGKYQKSLEEYLNDNTGGRPYLVRINNQLDFWVFEKANANSVVIGKDNYLYEQSYIDAYYGTDFVGDDVIKKKIQKLVQVTDSLDKRGVKLMVAFAPGKGSFFPEYFPNELKVKKQRTNYAVYKEAFEQTNIPFVDFRSWFESMKETSKYPLFPKGGIHWSSYGEVLAGDSLIKFMNNLTDKSKLNSIQFKNISPSNYAYNRDEDIEESMNLLFNMEDGVLGYPDFIPVKHNSKRTTRVLAIADSYFWGIYHWGATDYFENSAFWYYNREIYPESFTKQTFVQNLVDLASEVEKIDVVLIMFTDANLKDFAYDFVDRLYEEYCSDGRQKREKRIAQIIQSIRNTPEWLESIKQQAKQEGISLDEALRKNAVYMMIQEQEAEKNK